MPRTELAERPRKKRQADNWADDRWTWAERARRYDHAGDEYRAPEPGVRRTVTITGHPADRASVRRNESTGSRHLPARSTSRAVAPHHRPGFQPDRVAMWAVLLGFALVLIAATSAHT